MSTLRVLAAVGRWPVRHWRFTATLLVLALVAGLAGSDRLAVAAVLAVILPATVAAVWSVGVAGLIRAVGGRSVPALVVAPLGAPVLAAPGPRMRPRGPPRSEAAG